MYKFTTLFLLSSFFLVSCGSEDQAKIDSRTPFLVETRTIRSMVGYQSIEKPGRVVANSTLSLASDGIGQVQSIDVKEGDYVKKGTTLVRLKDTNGMYGIRLKQAENALRGQNVGLESTSVNVDRSILDAQVAYDQAKRNHTTLLSDIVERKKKAENDFFNSNPLNSGSTAAINVEKIQVDLNKADIDYKNLITNNQQTLTNLDSSYHVFANDIEKMLNQITFEGDKILGISNANQNANDGFEAYLGARNSSTKTLAENLYARSEKNLISILEKKSVLLTEENALVEMQKLIVIYQETRDYINSMVNLFENTVQGGTSLSQTQIDGWNTIWNGFKSQMQLSESSFVSFKNQTMTFLNTYKNTESSSKASIESLKKQLELGSKNISNGDSDGTINYNRTLIGFNDQIKAAELQLKQAENALNVAKKSKGISLDQADVGKVNAMISLEQARRDYEKLFIIAPVSGRVTKILASPGQSVNAGTPMVEFVSDKPEVVIDLDGYLAQSLQSDDEVTIISNEGVVYTGSILGVSSVANSNLLYTTRVSIPEATDILGTAVKVVFSLYQTENQVFLPISSVRLVSEQEGEVFILSGMTLTGSSLSFVPVKLGKVRGENIEILSGLIPGNEVILSDVTNFDPVKNVFKK